MFSKVWATATSAKDSVLDSVRAEHDLELQRVRLESERRIQALEVQRDQYRAELLALADAVKHHAGNKVSSAVATAKELGERALRLLSATELTETVACEVSDANRLSVENTKVISEAADRLSATIQMVNSKLDQTSECMGNVIGASSRAKATITELSSAVSKIEEVVSVIREIATQTNLLALNATIEAARAGEAGKGFAVVASEVKQLSTQTARSTEEIRGKIEDIIRVTRSTVEANEEIDLMIKEANESANQAGLAMNDQKIATTEIVERVAQTLPIVDRVLSSMQGVQQEAHAAKGVAESVKNSSDTLGSTTSELRDIIFDIVEGVALSKERRGPARFAVNHGAEVKFREYDAAGLEARTDGDVLAAVNIENLSLTGALISGAGKLQAGNRGRLFINRQPVNFEVVAITPFCQRVKFIEPLSRDFRAMFDELTKNLVPISQGRGQPA